MLLSHEQVLSKKGDDARIFRLTEIVYVALVSKAGPARAPVNRLQKARNPP